MSYKRTSPGERGLMTELGAASFSYATASTSPVLVERTAPSIKPKAIQLDTAAPIGPTSSSPTRPDSTDLAKAKQSAYDATIKTAPPVVQHPTTGEPVVPVPPSIPPAVATTIRTAPAPTSSKTAPPPLTPLVVSPPPPIPSESAATATSDGKPSFAKIAVVAGIVGLVGYLAWRRR